MFIRYPHLERLGNKEVEDIEHGVCHIFPKLDGTNASVWFKGYHKGECDDTMLLGAGSRNREVSLESDNQGFAAWVTLQTSHGKEEHSPLEMFFSEHRRKRLYGEWLVPHTLKGYANTAWNKFYVFDVYDDETQQFIPYEEYQPWLEQYKIDYIPCFWKAKNLSYEQAVHYAKECRFLLKEDCPMGEGVVIKNYNWINQFGRQTWAKVVTAEFKAEHVRAMGPMEHETKLVEDTIVNYAVTPALVEKEYTKIVVENGGWSSKYIPRLLETMYYCLVTEELYTALKKTNFPSVNFKTLKHFCTAKVKELKPELF